jgi:hypothetical protein
MLRRVFVRRRIAAADVAAGQAQSQMHSVASDAQTVFATFGAGRHVLNLIQMLAGVLHSSPLANVGQDAILSHDQLASF